MQIESNWKYKHIQLWKSVSVTSLTYVISSIVAKVSVLSNLHIFGCELKENYCISFDLLLKTNFSQRGFSIAGAGYTFYLV